MISSGLWEFVVDWLLIDYFRHQGLRLWADQTFQKIQRLMDDGPRRVGGSIQGKPALMVRCRSPRVDVEEHPIMFLGDVCPAFQARLPDSLLDGRCSSWPSRCLWACCAVTGMPCAFNGTGRSRRVCSLCRISRPTSALGVGLSMDAPISKHIIAWLWQFFRWMWCDWPSLGLGMPVSFAIYDIRGDAACLVKGPGRAAPGIDERRHTRLACYACPTRSTTPTATTSLAALNITALHIEKPKAAAVVAGLRPWSGCL